VPKLWNDTIATHRQDVRDAILDATAALVAAHGLSAVTMSQIAKESGIGRATLYKYFSDVQAIVVAWHERLVSAHLAQLLAARALAGDAITRLQAMLETYARIAHAEHGSELVARLHGGEHVTKAYEQLTKVLRELLAEGVKAGQLRDDVAPAELATFCLHALGAASSLPSLAAVRRLVAVTMSGLRQPPR
jgi:AcrR family transcriptional regulator